MTVTTRFAPSPTGDLHIGHAYAAWLAREAARERGGRFLVRIEDIDADRCREAFVARNLEDLDWLGLTPDEPVTRQSARLRHYRAALERLQAAGVVYPCFCTRREIREEIASAGRAPHPAADGGLIYPGTCRELASQRRDSLIASGRSYALRLDSARALERTGGLTWRDRLHGRFDVTLDGLGDVVIARKDIATSYHLAVVVDDAAQGVTEVTRGEDLLAASHLHRVLQALLGLPEPLWHHHPLCRDESGARLAKRKGDATVRALRARGCSPAEVLALARARVAPGAVAGQA